MHLCDYVLMSLCTYILMCLCAYVLMYSCTHALMYSCTHVLMYSCTHVLMCLCTYVLAEAARSKRSVLPNALHLLTLPHPHTHTPTQHAVLLSPQSMSTLRMSTLTRHTSVTKSGPAAIPLPPQICPQQPVDKHQYPTGMGGPELAATGGPRDAHCLLHMSKHLHPTGRGGAGLVATAAHLDDLWLLHMRK
jgi:hypothetical protein